MPAATNAPPDFAVLRAALQPQGRDIVGLLQVHRTGHAAPPHALMHWQWQAATLAELVRASDANEVAAALLSSFVEQLAAELARMPALPPGAPLWLELDRAAGPLGAIDWEALLVPALHRPVLRLPGLDQRPPLRARALDVVLICPAPTSPHLPMHASRIANIVKAVLECGREGAATLHLFVPALHADELRLAFGTDARVKVVSAATAGHDSAGTPDPGRPCPASPRSAWLRWVQDTMAGRAVDIVHIVGNATADTERPALMPGLLPTSSDAEGPHDTDVSVAEFAAFLTQLGAWGAVLNDGPLNPGAGATRLRRFAAALAHARAGVTLHVQQAGAAQRLAGLYRFITSATPQPVPPQPGWFACVPTALVQGQPAAPPGAQSRPVPRFSGLGSGPGGFASGRQPPLPSPKPAAAASDAAPEQQAWLRVAQRHLEQVEMDLLRRRSGQAADSSSTARQAAAERTLQRLKSALAEAARLPPPANKD